MEEKYCVVITTINHPTRAVREIARDAVKLDASLILIGDQKSPDDFNQEGAIYLSLNDQKKTGFKYAEIAPARHYARKNIGYLVAIRNGATVIVETDDDNIPREEFWLKRKSHISALVVDGPRWINVYKYFSDEHIWPRGLPLDQLTAKPPEVPEELSEDVYCPIQQGLADDNPDVDAIYRLVLPLPVTFERASTVALRGAWCPFNSQNTSWWPEAFPLLYLPFYCSFRMTDIWRSFVAQRIAYLNGWGISFHNATVFQERNEHSLLKDFEDEIPGYLHNHRIREALDALDLPVGVDNIGEAMKACYVRLVEMELVGSGELPLLDAWLHDVAALHMGAADRHLGIVP